MLEYYSETYSPDNRVKFLEDKGEDDIIIGGTVTHVFTLPFKFSSYAKECTIIYKQGLSVVLNKNNYTVDEHNFCSVLTLKLTPAETRLFKYCSLNTSVQMKIVTLDDEVVYNTPSPLIVRKPLDVAYTEN